jgi:hypothetical protein
VKRLPASAGALLIASLLILLQGCAALMPVTPTTSGESGSGAPANSTAGGATGAQAGSAAAATRAPLDSLPSSDAKRVLDSIPEPVPAAERVPPPAAAAGVAAGADSAAADSQGASVPIPAPTAPLGDKPGNAELAAAAGGAVGAAADSLAAHGSPSAAGASGAGSSVSAANPAAPAGAAGAAAVKPPGSCYRLQVAAPKERSQAESMKRAAESQLEVPFTITHVKTLYKVQTRDCLDVDAVQHLRARARASGFSGAFTTTDGAK